MITTLPSAVPPVAEIRGAATEYKSGDMLIQALKLSSLALYPNEAAQTKGIRGFGNAIAYKTLKRARYFGAVPADQVSCILVRISRPGTEAAVVRNINSHLSGVRAWQLAEFRSSIVASTLATTSIAQSTRTLVIFALIAGFFIIGLTMYSSALDRIKDYGTLKAIGTSNGYIRRLILGQALLFALLGFVIAYGLLEAFRQGVSDSGLRLPLQLRSQLRQKESQQLTNWLDYIRASGLLRIVLEEPLSSPIMFHFSLIRASRWRPIHLSTLLFFT